MEKSCVLKKVVTCAALDELWLHVIYKCNLNCRHCLFSCSPEKEGPGHLSLRETVKYVKEALGQGVRAIYITGGEPLIWPYLNDFLSWYYTLERVVPLTILTNGTLIGLEQASFFSRFTSQGLNLRVSLECYTRENHEEYRGAGSFSRAIQGIKNLNTCGIRPWVAYVNKSGGRLGSSPSQKLEDDFRQRLNADHGLQIAGLKIIAAYAKGRFAGLVQPEVTLEQVAEKMDCLQCTYGVAVSKNGMFPCPVLVDVPQAAMVGSLKEVVGKSFTLNYDFCISCFATGTTCGQ
ncbi:MAG: hypothetical protein CVV03_05530 [Firmicutes bacterium HGW-Firmicutes-8]|nr:MAG: hypothetical protein CVV03_05530 [Firmicutes bacterium HGW-Firmicutes-8]